MPPLKIAENHAPSAPLLSSAALAGGRKPEAAPPPEVKLKKGVFGMSNSTAIYIGIGVAALIILPVSGVMLQAKIKAIWMHFNQLPPAAAQIFAPPPVPKKVPMPEVKPGTFNVSSISLDGATHLAVINGQELAEGDAVPVPNQPGWKLAQIRESEVLLDFFGNSLVVKLNVALNTKPLNDQLHPLN